MYIVHMIPKFTVTIDGTVIGGAASSLYNLAEQQTTDNQVAILSHFPATGENKRVPQANMEFYKMNMFSRQNSKEFGIEFTLRAFGNGIGSRKGIDVLHGHSGHVDYILSTIAYACSRKLPVVYSLYCPITLKSQVTGFPGRTKLLSSLTRYIHRYIAISSNISKTMVSFGIPESKIRIIAPAVNTKKFHPANPDSVVKERLGIKNSSPVFLFVGSAAPTKNLETLIKAMSIIVKRLPEAALVITTELRLKHFEPRAQMLEELIQDLNLQNHVIQLGVIENMQQVMAASDILVAPFRSTDGPSDYFLAALEAMAVGRPVIVSSIGGMPEVVDEKVGLFINPDDAEQLADTMIELANQKEKREAMGREASKRITERFDPALVAEQVLSVYQEIL